MSKQDTVTMKQLFERWADENDDLSLIARKMAEIFENGSQWIVGEYKWVAIGTKMPTGWEKVALSEGETLVYSAKAGFKTDGQVPAHKHDVEFFSSTSPTGTELRSTSESRLAIGGTTGAQPESHGYVYSVGKAGHAKPAFDVQSTGEPMLGYATETTTGSTTETGTGTKVVASGVGAELWIYKG